MSGYRKMRIKFLRLAFIPILMAVPFFGATWQQNSVIRYVVEWVGFGFLAGGQVLRIWSMCYIGQRKSKELVKTGPYSMCRNPLYIGTLAVVIGISLSLENMVMGLVSVVVMVAVHLGVTAAEEKHMEEIFGEEFLEYKHKTPRFWFALRQYAAPPTIEVPVRIMRRVMVDTALVMLVLPLADLIELLHNMRILPVIWRFP